MILLGLKFIATMVYTVCNIQTCSTRTCIW